MVGIGNFVEGLEYKVSFPFCIEVNTADDDMVFCCWTAFVDDSTALSNDSLYPRLLVIVIGSLSGSGSTSLSGTFH